MSNPRGTTTVALPPIEVGTRLTDFSSLDLRVEGTASGGMGFVAWGPNAARGGEVEAVKLIRPDLLVGYSEGERARLRADFEREALTWCHVWHHAAIITTAGLTRLPGWDSLPVLVLEYAPQGNLRAVLTHGHQPRNYFALDAAFAWAQQIAAALAAIHAPDPDHERPQPLVHCDLKPENVLLDAEGDAMLTDLGLAHPYAEASAAPPAAPDPTASARVAALGTRSERVPPLPAARAVGTRGPVAGTPAYMAPEQWLGLDAVGPATDIYALGVLLFELFAGVDAFPIVPDLRAAHTREDVFAAWYEAHRQGSRLTLSDPAVAALAEGPLGELLTDAAGAMRAREVLGELERLVAACLSVPMELRPTAEQVRAWLAALAERTGLAPTDIPEVTPHTPEHEATFWSNLGVTAGNLGQHEEKLRLCRRAVEADPEDPASWSNLGVAYKELDQVEEALAAYQQAERLLTPEWVARYPELPTGLLSNLGTVLNLHGRYAESVAAYQRALAVAPDKANTRLNLAVTYAIWAEASGELAQRSERLRLARNELLRAVEIQPGFAKARQVLAQVEERLRRG